MWPIILQLLQEVPAASREPSVSVRVSRPAGAVPRPGGSALGLGGRWRFHQRSCVSSRLSFFLPQMEALKRSERGHKWSEPRSSSGSFDKYLLI